MEEIVENTNAWITWRHDIIIPLNVFTNQKQLNNLIEAFCHSLIAQEHMANYV